MLVQYIDARLSGNVTFSATKVEAAEICFKNATFLFGWKKLRYSNTGFYSFIPERA